MPNKKIVTVKRVKAINTHRNDLIYATCRYENCERDYNKTKKKTKEKKYFIVFEGLKTTLFLLFSEEALRVSSLKEITTVAGGSSTTLDKDKLNLIYCKSFFLELPQISKIAAFSLPDFKPTSSL